MRRYRAEAASAKTPSVHIDGKLDHFKGGYCTALLVFGMRLTHIGQVKRRIDLSFAHRLIRRVDHEELLPHALQQSTSKLLVRLLLYVFEIARERLLVPQTLLVRRQLLQRAVALTRAAWQAGGVIGARGAGAHV